MATARILAQRGAILSLVDTNKQGLDEAIKSLPGEKHISTVVDVQNSSEVDLWIDKTVSKLGSLHGAVNLAGVVGPMSPITDLTSNDWDYVMGMLLYLQNWKYFNLLQTGVNGKGVFNCLRAQLRAINDGGSIVSNWFPILKKGGSITFFMNRITK